MREQNTGRRGDVGELDRRDFGAGGDGGDGCADGRDFRQRGRGFTLEIPVESAREEGQAKQRDERPAKRPPDDGVVQMRDFFFGFGCGLGFAVIGTGRTFPAARRSRSAIARPSPSRGGDEATMTSQPRRSNSRSNS